MATAAAPRRPSLFPLFAVLSILIPVVLARKLLKDSLYIVDDDVIGSYCDVVLGSPFEPFSSIDICMRVHRHPSQPNSISHISFKALVEGVTSASYPSAPTVSLTDSLTVTVPCSQYESEPYDYIEGSLLYRCQQDIPKESLNVIIKGLAESPFPRVTLTVGDTPVSMTLSRSATAL